MFDDETFRDGEADSPLNAYWTEAQWEKYLVENEKLIDRYEKVFEENPQRVWDDPTDLYFKVHYGIDLGEDMKKSLAAESFDRFLGDESAVSGLQTDEDVLSSPGAMEAELREIPAYQKAFQFSLGLHDAVQSLPLVSDAEQKQAEDLCAHAFQVAAHIAGGHGLGYEEDALCGNIVKNRWALQCAGKTGFLLRQLKPRFPQDIFLGFESQLISLQAELRRRIQTLRSKVWWQQ